MNQIFTAAELKAKGFTSRDVKAMMRRCETRVKGYAKQYAANGKCTANFQAAWDAECARWDHIKATLAGMQ